MAKMKLTKGLLTLEEAKALAPDYVEYMGTGKIGKKNFDVLSDKVLPKFETLRKGQQVITCNDGQYVLGYISSVNRNDWRAVDGPIVRVTNGEYSWRVDGCDYAYPIEEVAKKKKAKA